MQVPDEQKRINIMSAAAELFAEQAFHKVVLSDVAEKAGVGKGTLYIYFKNKEDLYLSVLLDGFSRLVSRLQDRVGVPENGPLDDLELVVREIVVFAFRDRHLFEIMRNVPMGVDTIREQWKTKRRELKNLILAILQRGLDSGIFRDTNPDLTARYIPGLVRAALLHGVDGLDEDSLSRHIFGFVRNAIIHPSESKGTTP